MRAALLWRGSPTSMCLAHHPEPVEICCYTGRRRRLAGRHPRANPQSCQGYFEVDQKVSRQQYLIRIRSGRHLDGSLRTEVTLKVCEARSRTCIYAGVSCHGVCLLSEGHTLQLCSPAPIDVVIYHEITTHEPLQMSFIRFVSDRPVEGGNRTPIPMTLKSSLTQWLSGLVFILNM